MAGFSELIKSFDKTRDYIRDFFIYGFKTRSQFTGKSPRTYDDEKRRVESWLGDLLTYDSTQRGKQVSISVDSGHIYENPLFNAYYSKSFTDNDIKLHFLLLDIIGSTPMTLREITDALGAAYGEVYDEQTVRNKLKEYTDEGIFIRSKQGKADAFSLSEDTAESFFESIDGLDEAVRFYSQDTDFGIIGNSLLKTAGLENDIFLYKHNYIVHTLEDEILLELLVHIENKHRIKAEHFGKKGDSEQYEGVPLKIFVSAQTGRRYIIMYIFQYRRFNAFRLDSIKSVKDMGICPDYDHYHEKLCANEGKVFGVSFGNSYIRCSGNFRMVIKADEKTEGFIADRLEREKRCGAVNKISDDLYEYTAEVFDVNEMMSWVKTFTGRVISAESENEDAAQRLYSDFSRMYEMYCGGEDSEDIQ